MRIQGNGQTSTGQLNVRAQDAVAEGGEIQLEGAGNYDKWHVDNYAGHLRIFNTGGEHFRLTQDGKLGIDVTNPNEKLEVDGNLKANGVILNIGTFPDYVFSDNYDLISLEEIEAYIKANKRLPNMPSEQEVIEKGLDVKQINLLLVEKVEELTLHSIQLKKENKQLKSQLKSFEQRLKALEDNE